jgi:hypothetical protein
VTANDLQEAHALAVLAILQAYGAAVPRLTQEQTAQVHRRVESGEAVLALSVTNDGKTVHVELALIPRDSKPFTNAPLRLDGPVMAVAAAPGSLPMVDHNSLN